MKQVILNEDRGHYGTAFLAGILGAAVMTFMIFLARTMGLTQMNLSVMLGSMLTGTMDGNNTALLGFAWHLLNGGIFALVYSWGFNKLNRASIGLGSGFGVVHWIIAGIFMGVLPMMHPLIPEQMMAPGYFAINAGAFDFIAELMLHAIYGGVVGGTYQLAVSRAKEHRLQTHRPVGTHA